MSEVKAICKKCGKEFMAANAGQKYCQKPCKSPLYEKAEGPVWPTEMARRDCKSFFELPEGLCTCRALKRLYCNFEKCKFYKKK